MWLLGTLEGVLRRSVRTSFHASLVPIANCPMYISCCCKRRPKRQSQPRPRSSGAGLYSCTSMKQNGEGKASWFAPGLLTAVVGKNKDSNGLVSIHLPPKATLDETETMLAQLGATPALQRPRLVLGFDCNETFDFEGAEVRSRTARGEAILVWAVHHELRLPLQQGTTPSYFPYNASQQPRRLDYLWVRGLRTPWEGEVLQKTRTMMGSDHDAVAIFLPPQLETPFLARKSPTSPKDSAPGLPITYSCAPHGVDLRMDTADQREDHTGQKTPDRLPGICGPQTSTTARPASQCPPTSSRALETSMEDRKIGEESVRQRPGRQSATKTLGSPQRNPNAATTAVAIISSFKP